MKNIFKILALLMLVLTSCSDEMEEITEEPQFPDPTELITGNITGTIVDQGSNEPVDGVTVDLIASEILLASTQTLGGSYSFEEQALASETLIRVHSTTFAPSYRVSAIEANNDVQENFTLSTFDNIQEEQTEAFVLKTDNGLAVEFFDEYMSEYESVRIGYKSFSFPEDAAVLDFNQGVDAEGQVISLSFDQAYCLSAYSADGTVSLQSADKEFNVSIDNATGKSIWMLSTSTGMWKEVTEYDIRGEAVRLSTDQFTYYATVAPDCDEDTEQPIVVCLQNYDLDLSIQEWLRVDDVDNGSYDNCDDNISLTYKKDIQDACDGPPPGYSITQLFCNEESRQVIPCVLRAMDASGNFSECSFTVTVSNEIDCAGNADAPIPYCVNNLSVELNDGSAILVAGAIDVGSFDECTAQSDLLFQIRKQSDICGNGSDSFGATIEFCLAELGNDLRVEMNVTDENGNSDYCVSTVTLTECPDDDTAPIAIAVQELQVSYSSQTIVRAEELDNFSYDFCSTDLTYQVRKISDICNNGSDQNDASIELCLAEVGTNIDVYLVVIDGSGNTAEVQTTIEVLD